ncbi:MAG: hypothetical protein JWO49_2102 [Arthrobacter sp.]|nr:hypothetical protein [Arthrobacter sp.]
MRRLLRSIRTELRYEAWSKMLLWPLAVSVLSVGLTLSGSISNAAVTLSRLHSTTAEAQANGVSLTDAMDRPVNLSVQGNQQFLDNPLRFDYEQAYNAHRALDGWNSIGTGLEMMTFIVLPLLFFVYGCSVAVSDVRQRILKHRVTAQGAGPYVLAKVAVISGVAVASVLLCAALSLAAGPVLKAVFYSTAAPEFPFPVQESGNSNPVLQFAFSAGTALLFGQLGFFIGLVTRALLLPSLVAGGLLMVTPFAGAYDPRNVLSVAGQGVYNFWGGFNPGVLFPVPTEAGLALMVLGVGVIALGCVKVWSRLTKFV